MALDTVRARWVEATYINQPEARCGHSAVAVDSRECWGEEFLVRAGRLLCKTGSRLVQQFLARVLPQCRPQIVTAFVTPLDSTAPPS